MESAGNSSKSMGLVQKWGCGGTVACCHSTTRVRTLVIFTLQPGFSHRLFGGRSIFKRSGLRRPLLDIFQEPLANRADVFTHQFRGRLPVSFFKSPNNLAMLLYRVMAGQGKCHVA